VQSFLARHGIDALINTPHQWDPRIEGWYDMPWGGEGSKRADGSVNPENGREPLQGAYAGQIIKASTFYDDPPPNISSFQNHSVVYYNDVAGAMLGQVWANPLQPDLSAIENGFPEGSLIVKVEGAAVKGWDILQGSAQSFVYRPTAANVEESMAKDDPSLLKPEKVSMYFAQMAVKIKDKVASPTTGWVFMGFTYDVRLLSSKPTVWERVVPVGATWGNDPECTDDYAGTCANGQPLQETWINQAAPSFTQDSLGWGNRLAAPMDVARRHNVITVDGNRHTGNPPDVFPASSCMSCHGSAQYPFVANLYPSPNMVFPEDGKPFLFFTPGKPDWAGWFQNRPGTVAMSGNNRKGIVALDYDMMITLALMSALNGAGEDAFLTNLEFGH
jgi:hypothetical protein